MLGNTTPWYNYEIGGNLYKANVHKIPIEDIPTFTKLL